MTTLTEALARLDRTKAPNVYRPDIEPIVAAARNWQTLIENSDKTQWCRYHNAEVVNRRDGLCWDAEERGHACEPVDVFVVAAVRVTGENPQ